MALSEQAEARPIPPAILWMVMFGIGVAWGACGPFSKIAVSSGHHPIGITFWSSVIGAAILLPALWASGRRLPLDWVSIRFFLICGFIGTAFPNSLSYEGYRHLPVGIVLMVVALTPMTTFAVAWPLGLDKATPRRIAGLLLGIAAMAMLLWPEDSSSEPGRVFWTLAMLGVTAAYAMENVYIARSKPAGLDSLSVMAGLFCGAVLLLGPTVLLVDGLFSLAPFGAPEQAVVAVALLHLGAYFAFVWLIGAAGPVFAAQVGHIATASGVFFGIIWFDEQHPAWVWAALATLFIGLALVQPRRDAA